MNLSQGTAMFLPAWNEADNLPTVVEEAVTYLRSREEPFVVIIIDDGSIDHTPQVAAQLQQTYPGDIQFIQHDTNQGYGAALRSGFRAGLDSGLSWIGFCDADHQFKPHDIGLLLENASTTDADIAIGFRIKRADGAMRRFVGRSWHLLSRSVLNYEATDVDCGFKLFSRDALLIIEPKLTSKYASISPELLTHARQAGLKIVEVGVNHYPRSHGVQSGANWHVMWESFVGLLRTRGKIDREA